MKSLIILFVLCLSASAFSQVPIDLQQKTATTTADSAKILLVANETSGAPYKSTVGTLFKNHVGYIFRKTSNASTSDVPANKWMVWKNTNTDSVFLYVRDSATLYKINLTKVE